MGCPGGVLIFVLSGDTGYFFIREWCTEQEEAHQANQTTDVHIRTSRRKTKGVVGTREGTLKVLNLSGQMDRLKKVRGQLVVAEPKSPA